MAPIGYRGAPLQAPRSNCLTKNPRQRAKPMSSCHFECLGARLEKLLQTLAHIVTQDSFLATNRPVSECARSPRDPYRSRLLNQAFRLHFGQQQ
jgi:hypothetical protein